MKIQSTTRHVVYPAQPAPPGSRIILSNNDQVMPRMYTSMLYYFSSPNVGSAGSDNFMSIEVLKQSLARALSLFYPLAGRYCLRTNGGVDIECTNEGVELLDVRIEGKFEEEFKGWQPTPASQLLLPQLGSTRVPSITSTALLYTQVTRFEGDVVSLGVAVHHHVCDGLGVTSFVAAWANISSGKTIGSSPVLDRSFLRCRDPPRPSFDHKEYKVEPVCLPSSLPAMTARMFEFGPGHIQALKNIAGVGDNGSSFTSYEVVAGHIWKSVTKARELEATKDVQLGFAVDGRKRLDPPLSESYFGNVNFYGVAVSIAGDLVAKPLAYAATLVHEAIASMTDEYMRSSLDWIEEKNNPASISPGFDSFLGPDLAMTSWVRFPVYEVDFGWGRPKFFGIQGYRWDGLTILLPSSSPGTVNVLVGLTVEAMTNLQSDVDFHFKI